MMRMACCSLHLGPIPCSYKFAVHSACLWLLQTPSKACELNACKVSSANAVQHLAFLLICTAESAGSAGGMVEWGHLAAGDSNLKAAFERRQGQQYDLVEEDPDAGAMPLPEGNSQRPMAPLGRGQEATKPAWMTHPDSAAAPGSTGE